MIEYWYDVYEDFGIWRGEIYAGSDLIHSIGSDIKNELIIKCDAFIDGIKFAKGEL